MSERQLTRDTIEQFLDYLEPDWDLRSAELADSGYLSVYHLAVATPDGDRECVLKANPFAEPNGVGLEARLLALIGCESSVPVPAVTALLDDHRELPTPAFLMERRSGRARQRHELGTIDRETLSTIARNLGRHLGDLHGIDAVDSYGYLAPADRQTFDGGRPDGSPSSIVVAEPTDSWPTALTDWADIALDGLTETRFAGRCPDIRQALEHGIDDLTGPFRPVLTHIDGSIENVLTTHDGEITAVLDWAFTLAAPPVYDLVLVEHSLAGGHWVHLPDAPDHRQVVREGLLAGYRETGAAHVIEQFRSDHDTYRLVALAHSLCHFEDWFDHHAVGDDRRAHAARSHRAAIDELL